MTVGMTEQAKTSAEAEAALRVYKDTISLLMRGVTQRMVDEGFDPEAAAAMVTAVVYVAMECGAGPERFGDLVLGAMNENLKLRAEALAKTGGH